MLNLATILLPDTDIDLGPQSRAALAWAGEFAGKYQWRLHVVYVLPSADWDPSPYCVDELRATLERSVKEQVYALLENASQRTGLLSEHGLVSKAVSGAAEAVKANCVMIGRHSNPGVLGQLHTDAYSIVRESPCPVISV
jgi:nucleotide-binding universal stress UspA family protein